MSAAKAAKKKAGKKSVKKAAPRKKPVKSLAPGILHPHADDLRSAIHDVLAKAGVQGLSLQSIRFASMSGCPDGQHAEKTCTRDAAGNEICTWNCVPN
jgi:preprotein translocase subunit SecB